MHTSILNNIISRGTDPDPIDADADFVHTERMEHAIAAFSSCNIEASELPLWYEAALIMNQWYIPFMLPFNHIIPSIERRIEENRQKSPLLASLAEEIAQKRIKEAESDQIDRRELDRLTALLPDRTLAFRLRFSDDTSLPLESLYALTLSFLEAFEQAPYGSSADEPTRYVCRQQIYRLTPRIISRFEEATDYDRTTIITLLHHVEETFGRVALDRDSCSFLHRVAMRTAEVS